MLGSIKRAIFISNLGWFVLAGFILISAGTLFALTSLPYFRAKFSPPTPVTLADLTRETVQIPTYFANVKGEATYDSGYYYETTTNVVFTSREYYGLLLVGDRLLLLKTGSSPDETRLDWTGTLALTTSEERLNVVNALEAEAPQIRGAILPYTLDAVDAYNWEWWAGLAVLLALVIFGASALIRSLRRFSDRGEHPIWNRLMRYGTDVPGTVEAIEREVKADSEKIGRLKMTRHWIVATGRDFRAMKIDDIVWVYKFTQKQYVNGIRVSVSHAATFHDKYGTQMAVTGKEAKVHEILGRIYARTPWAVAGHSDEIKAMWDKNRSEFLTAVQNRKRELDAAPKE